MNGQEFFLIALQYSDSDSKECFELTALNLNLFAYTKNIGC